MSTALQTEKKKAFTYKDYEKLPEGAPYQLIGGELVMTPSPVPYHQILIGRIFLTLSEYTKENNAGSVILSPIDVYFSETDTYQPDIIFIGRDRLDIIGKKKIEGAPDFIIEILSPATAYYDLRAKKDVYEQSGVKEYWIVDPMQKSIEAFVNKKGKFELAGSARSEGAVRSHILKGLAVSLKEIFE